jgi:type IV pilus assembly protein PilV
MLKVKSYSFASPKSQSGVLLIEAMVAILIFTIGVIALMGVQAAAVRSNSDSKIRMDAEFFADQLLSEMTVDGRNAAGEIDFAALQAKYGSGPAGGGFLRWRTRLQDVANGGIPKAGTAAVPLTVTVTQAVTNLGAPTVPPAAVVTISIQWLGPNDPTATPRKLVTTSVIRP